MFIARFSTSIILLLFALTGCKQSQDLEVTLHLSGLPDGTVLELKIAATHKEEKPLATATTVGGKATFSIAASEPLLYSIAETDAYGSIVFAADKGEKPVIEGEVETSEAQGRKVNDFQVSITGCPTNEAYQAQVPDRDRLNRMYEAYHEENKEIIAQIGQARMDKDTLKQNELWASSAGQKLTSDEKAFFDEVERVTYGTITDNRDSYLGPMLMMSQMNYLTEEQKDLYDSFSDAAKQSYYGVLAGKEICPPSLEGEAMPDFTATNWDTNEQTTFRRLCQGKRVVLLDFWASWCAPCRKEIPNLKAQYELYRDKGFEIVSISADTSDEQWKKALEEEGLTWPNFRDADKSIQQAYQVRFFPTMYLLDADGHCIAENARGEKLAQLLAELFK